MVSTVRDAVAAAAQRLARAGVPTPAVDAELLVRHIKGWSRTQLVLHGAQAWTDDEARRCEALVRRREAREPLQLILGTVAFRYLELEVRPGVFIPRPETEVLAGLAVERVGESGIVIEPCTGTGAIGCSVATESRAGEVLATDTSAVAVELARANAIRAGAALTVMHGDLLAPVPRRVQGRVDVIVSNPPYLTPEEVADLEPEVAAWDPMAALVSGSSGHEVSDRLIAAAADWLRPGGWLLLEVDSSRAAATARRATHEGLQGAAVLPDLTGADRIVAARRPAG